jgi:hypothetical protein
VERPVAERGAVLVPFLAIIPQGSQAALAPDRIDQRLPEHAPHRFDAVVDGFLHPRHRDRLNARADQGVEPALAVVHVMRKVVIAEHKTVLFAALPDFL